MTCGDVETEFQNVPCTACGCVCDDLTVRFQGQRFVQLDQDCPLARQWFTSVTNPGEEAARIAGQSVNYATALQAAGEILRQSQAPLIYGLSRSSTEGQRIAVALAEQLGGIIDTTASVCHGPSIMAIQEVGESTCSLGEVSQRADLVIYWGANPVLSHPRHLERYSLEPTSEFLPQGRRDRKLVVIDVAQTATAELADLFIQIQPGRDFELIWTLRKALQGDVESLSRAWPAEVSRLHEWLTSCRYGVVFFGLGVAQQGLGHVTVSGLLKLVAELNRVNRFVARRLRIPGDVAGADSVLCWQTGYPFAVDFSRGYPRYQPGEFTANHLLERGDVDACLLVGAESIPQFSAAAKRTLAQLPVVVLDPPAASVRIPQAVEFTTATYGIHAAGTAYRMDEVPIPLRKLVDSPWPTDAEVLRDLVQVCSENQAGCVERQ